MKTIQFTGRSENILRIMNSLPGHSKAISVNEKSITIPTTDGARQVFKGDIIVIDGDTVRVAEKEESR